MGLNKKFLIFGFQQIIIFQYYTFNLSVFSLNILNFGLILKMIKYMKLTSVRVHVCI